MTNGDYDLRTLMDPNKLASELGFDVETVKGLLATFVRTSTSDLADLEVAAAAGDCPAAARLAHHIKGAAANLELSDIAAAALAVETAAKAGSVAGAAPHLATMRAGLQAVRTAHA
jgi:HPt (histidine-containing phosphotransfer) domain-containing protein